MKKEKEKYFRRRRGKKMWVVECIYNEGK